MLTWEKLLCTERERKSSSSKSEKYVKRNPFESDYDRIIGSSSVRRLQDKAQVFPLQENDFTRTRLTHSIEVSALARSLGKAVGLELLEKNKMERDQVEELEALLQTIGLIHDLGNPPFGHYGEKVIRNWFDKYFQSSNNTSLTDKEKNDFLYFDGNVQNIRIITKLQTQNDEYGANFTYGTIASVIKYPWDSSNEKCLNSKNDKNKFGYFLSEKELIKKIRNKMNLYGETRHPATFLMEAADDIIYLCDDIEDGVKKGYIDWPTEYAKLKKVLPKYKNLFDDIDKKNPCSKMSKEEIVIANSRNFRNAVQSYLFKKAVKNFISRYDDIMTNKFEEKELLYTENDLIKKLKDIMKNTCFSSKEVIQLELVGDKVISTLLDIFVPVILEQEEKLVDTSTYPGKVFSLISPNFIFIALHKYLKEGIEESEVKEEKIKALKNLTEYEKLHIVVDFISGMTDSYAVNVYKELMGMSLI